MGGTINALFMITPNYPLIWITGIWTSYAGVDVISFETYQLNTYWYSALYMIWWL